MSKLRTLSLNSRSPWHGRKLSDQFVALTHREIGHLVETYHTYFVWRE